VIKLSLFEFPLTGGVYKGHLELISTRLWRADYSRLKEVKAGH